MIEVRLFCGKEPNIPTGVCVSSLQALRDVSRKYFDTVLNCPAGEIKPAEWTKKSILIFPGGKCSEWDLIISDEQRRLLHDYVKEGGAIFGICAGACFWVKSVKYLSMLSCRNHFLSSWTCKGPYTEELEVVEILWLKTQEKINVLVNKGVEFFPPEKSGEDEVLALYLKTSSPAVIFCSKGLGRLVLSGPHLEHGAKDLELIQNGFPLLEEKFKKMQRSLEETDPLRLKFLNDCFQSLIKSKM